MMTARVMRRLALAAVVVTLGVLALTRGGFRSLHASPARAARSGAPGITGAAREPGFSERAERDVQIKVWKQALDADSVSALAMGQLAALHLQRAREGGTWDDYLKAEEYARRSLAKRTNRNAGTAATLISVLLAQHRFTEARVIADELVQREPDIPEYRAALGEVAMELGDDATAEEMFRSVWSNRSTLTIGARLARWLEINNHVAEARRLLITSRDDALSRRDVASETKAWFALRVGDLELRSGHLRAAEQAFSLGLDIEPDDPRLLAAMARLAAARHDYRDVIDWGERAIGMQLDPATLGIVGDAYAALGNRSKADEYFKTLQVAVSMQPGAYHRAWSLYLLDHGLQVNDVLQKAQDELRDRKDVYGYDIVAWALEKSGRHAEAKQAMRQALRLRTPDPLLLRHAQVIGVTVDSVGTGA
jgi:tetratricopeptide (TPR) repeat protein